DAGNASRTQLLDLATLDWSPELLAAFAVPREVLPIAGRSAGLLGECRAPAALRGAALAALCGDSHAALYSHHLSEGPSASASLVKATYGTGSSVVAAARPPRAGEASAGALCWSVVWRLDDVSFGLEGNVAAAGAALEWGVGLLGCDDFATFEALAAAAGPSPVVAVPALAGLGPPWLAPAAQGVLEGLTLRSGAGEVAFAVFEGVAHQVADVVELLGAEGGSPRATRGAPPPDALPSPLAGGHLSPLAGTGGQRAGTGRLHADGGLSRSELLMQLQADLLGIELCCAARHEASALGAAYLAGIAVGLWREGDLAGRLPEARRFEPRLSERDREARRERWREAAGRCAAAAPQDAAADRQDAARRDAVARRDKEAR
ncbi:MAG TPA: FGGY-family carbohydrate kinase, partial [Acidimicrobiales bacterium]|nr:FGGY-family carbohydrate kinase [Acidimicrobiales bacterium]